MQDFAKDLKFLPSGSADELTAKVKKVASGLLKSVRRGLAEESRN
jgi:hypothetical protein